MEKEIKHFAVVDKSTSIVENVILGDTNFKSLYESENPNYTLVEYTEKPTNDIEVARIGEKYIPGVGFEFEDINKNIKINKITMRQARLQLLKEELLDDVEALVILNKERQIEWEYASEVYRNSNLINSIKESIGLTDEQLDDMFVAASKL